jgi:hypothetical protein
MSKKQNLKSKLEDEFEQIQGASDNLDIANYLAKKEDLPGLGEIQIYDYDADLTVATNQAMGVLESLVDLYLGDVPGIKEHSYIKNKMKEDAMVYAETLFLSKMTRRNFLTQLRQIDNGDNNARMHEVINQTIREVRDNSKFSSTQRTDLEKFYKEIRKDLGLNEMSENNTLSDQQKDEKDEKGKVTDIRNMNETIEKYLKNK